MRIEKAEIIGYKNFRNAKIKFNKYNKFPDVFTVASKNGGGKSTFLQFIFIILHCFMDDNRKEYIKNFLYVFNNIEEEVKFAKFILAHDNKRYYLNFKILPSKTEEYDFDLYLDIKDTETRIKEAEKNLLKYKKILNLKNELENTNRVSPVLERDILKYIGKYISTEQENNLFKIENIRISKDLNFYKKLIEDVLNENFIQEDDLKELKSIYNKIQQDLENLEKKMDINNIKYITRLNNKNVILLETDMSEKLLRELSNKIFLTAPNSQIFLFLSKIEKHSIFGDLEEKDDILSFFEDGFDNTKKSYFDYIKSAKKDLNNFYTYDFASTELILKSFRKAVEEDFKEKRKKGKYGTHYDNLINELKNFLDNIEIIENENGDRVIFKSKSDGKELSPEDLSHGELKKLGIYIWLKYIVEQDSIVLMDEPDIAFHPKWQSELVKDLSKWSKNTQFILATHSPQIIGSTYYRNIIKLDNGNVKRYKKPPVDRDINSIVEEIMEADSFPKELLELHKKYRKLINEGKKDTKEAEKLKEEILEYESENSSFFQDINFDLELF